MSTSADSLSTAAAAAGSQSHSSQQPAGAATWAAVRQLLAGLSEPDWAEARRNLEGMTEAEWAALAAAAQEESEWEAWAEAGSGQAEGQKRFGQGVRPAASALWISDTVEGSSQATSSLGLLEACSAAGQA